MKILTNPLVLGAIALGVGYIALKSGVFDSILAGDIKSWATPEQIARWRTNSTLRPGIKANL